MHRLLKRQITKHLAGKGSIPAEMKGFIASVNQAYIQFDVDREMLERALELSSEELLEANSELRAVIDAFPDLFFRLDKNGKINFFQSSSSQNIFPGKPDLIGKKIQDIPSKEVGKKFSKALEAVTRTGKKVRIEYSMFIGSKLQFFEARMLPVLLDQIFVIVRNITASKQSEQALIEEKERLAVTLRSIGDGVISTDIYGKVTLINKTAEELTGWSYKEAIGQPLSTILQYLDKQNNRIEKNIMDRISRSENRIGPVLNGILVDKLGVKKNISESAATIKDQGGNAIGAVFVFRDITEKLKLEKELIKNEKMESIGLLASGLAHDFNNVLNAILGNISLAKMYITPENKGYKRLTKAEKSSVLARGLTQQLLTFAKGGDPVKESCRIKDLLTDTIQFVLSGSHIKCQFDFPEEIWSVEVDKVQISQVIQNLTINSVQAMSNGGLIQIRVENIREDNSSQGPLKSGSYVKISLTDQGKGIEKSQLSQIFEPYFTTKAEGSGLGLAVSYSIIKSHGGHISLESEVNKGTTFFIFLPSNEGAPTPLVEQEYLKYGGKEKILLMDDESDILDVLDEFLTTLGYETECVEDGEEAIKAYTSAIKTGNPFDAVIMDLTIPGGMGGEETIKNLMKIDPQVKAIVTSGYSSGRVMENYKQYGFSGVITKPYGIERISEILHQVISGSE